MHSLRTTTKPPNRRWRRSATLSSLAVLTALLTQPMLASPAAFGDDGPQTFGMSMVTDSGRIVIGGQEPGQPLANPTSINGKFDPATGELSDVNFSSPPITFEQHVTKPIPLDMTITETLIQLNPGSGTGTLDQAGNLTLDLAFALRVQLASSLANGDCVSKPVNVQLTSTEPYDASTGRVSLSAEGFEVQNFEVTDKCAKLIVDNSGAQFAGTNNRLAMTFEGSLGTPLAQTSLGLAVTPDSPVMRGDETTLTATISPTEATGTVNFLSGNELVGAATLNNGTASITTKLQAREHQLRAEYGGDADHAGSSTAPIPYVVRAHASLSGDVPDLIRPGAAPKEFTLVANNPSGGRDENVRLDWKFTQSGAQWDPAGPGYDDNIDPDHIVVELKDAGGAWQRVPVEGVVAPIPDAYTLSLGGANGFAFPSGSSKTFPMRISLAAAAPAGQTMTIGIALKRVDPSTGAAGNSLDESSVTVRVPLAQRVNLLAIEPSMLFVGPPPYRYARGYDMNWRVRTTYYDPALRPLPLPTGAVEFLVDGVPTLMNGTQETLPLQAGTGGISSSLLGTRNLVPGMHTLQVRYLGDLNYKPLMSAPMQFEILPAFGQLYSCEYNALGNILTQKMLISAEGDLPVAAPAGKELSIDNIVVTVGADQRTKVQLGRDFDADLGDDGSLALPNVVLTNPNTAHNDVRLTFSGAGGTTTLSGQPGDKVDVSLPVVRFSAGSGLAERNFTCTPFDKAASLGKVQIIGTKLAVTPNRATAPGEQVTLEATVSPTSGASVPFQRVTFYAGDQVLGMATPDYFTGKASVTTSNLQAGRHVLTAVWSGQIGVPTSTSNAVEHQVVGNTVTTVTSSADPSAYGAPVRFTATVTGGSTTPGGSVQFAVDGTPVGDPVALADGSAQSPAIATMAVGDHMITATYLGDDSHSGSIGNLDQAVTAAATQLSATPALVQIAGLKLHLSNLNAKLVTANGPVAGQQIVFKSGPRTLCTATTTANGSASCNALASILDVVLGFGYTANYAGSASYLPSTAKAALIK